MFIRFQLRNNWHNLLEQFPHIAQASFAILFSTEKTAVFKKCNFCGQAFFLHSGNQVFAYRTYIFHSYNIMNYL